MKKFRKNKKMMSLLLALAFLVSTFTVYAKEYVYATDFVDIAMFEDADFDLEGVTETVVLDMDCNTITLYGELEDEGSETVFLHLVRKDNQNYNVTIPFTANGSSYLTDQYEIAEGRYYAWFTGSTTNTKSYAVAYFTVWVE